MIDLKASLAARFKMKDMGKLYYCLGTMDGVFQMSQEQYIHKILHKYKLQDCKPDRRQRGCECKASER